MSSTIQTPPFTKKPSVERFIVASLICALGLTCFHGSTLHAQGLGEVDGAKQICSAGPEAQLARAERLRGTAEVTAADVLPNPSLVVEHQRSLRGPTDEETVVGVSVPLGVGGRRSLLQDAAAARRDQAIAAADATLFESAIAFREAYASAVIDRRRVGVLEQQQAVLDELSLTIAGLTRGGETAQYDLLRQRIQTQVHRRVLQSAKARAGASLVRLEAWLGANVEIAATNPFDLAGGVAGDQRAVDEDRSRSLRLRSLDADAQASGLEARAAERRWVPEIELFAGYRGTRVTQETGHGVALSLRIPVTIFDHGQGEAARARAAQEQARANAELLRRENSAHLKSADAQLETLSASVEEGEPLLADAASLLEKARQLYAAGEATITELLEAFRASEEARLELLDLAEELVRARLDRMRAAGTQLDATLDKACHGTRRSAP